MKNTNADIAAKNAETLARMRGPRTAVASAEKPVLVPNNTPDTFEA